MRFETVLFDLDGTVIDSGAMIVASFRHATSVVLGRELREDQLASALAGATLHDQMGLLDRERVDALVDVYREHNRPRHRDLQPCTGTLSVLRHLKDEGRRLGIVTAKRRVTAELAFAVLPLGEFFEVVVTADDTERHKPQPDPVLLALHRLGGRADSAAFVGDSPVDVEAGKAASVFSVAVLWGGLHSPARLRAAEPDAIVSTPEELLAVL